MKLKNTPVGKRSEILASDHFLAVPVVVAGSSAVKAGIPLKNDGTPVPAGTDAAGILLYDTDPSGNPNAAMLVHGVVDWSKCRASGAQADAQTMSGILPNIAFRENVGASDVSNS